MKKMISKIIVTPIDILLLLVGVVLVSCTSNALPVPEGETEKIHIGNPNETPTQPPTFVAIKQQTATFISETNGTPTLPVTTIISPTLAIPSTQLSTPILTKEQRANYLSELMLTNKNCELPCWWGIQPGQSVLEVVVNEFTTKGFEWWAEDKWLIGLDFAVIVILEPTEGVIQSINIVADAQDEFFVQNWISYDLSQVLSHYGQPTRVQIYAPFRADPGGGPSYRLHVLYELSGIAIIYTGAAIEVNDKNQVCPNLTHLHGIELFLYQPDKINNVLEVVMPAETVSFIAEQDAVYDLTSWEQATGTGLDFFYETFKEANNYACFEF